MPFQRIQISQEGPIPGVYVFTTMPLISLERSADYDTQPILWSSEPLVIFLKTQPLMVDLEWRVAAINKSYPDFDDNEHFPSNPGRLMFNGVPAGGPNPDPPVFSNGISFLASLQMPNATVGTGVDNKIPPKICRFTINPAWFDIRCIVRKFRFVPDAPWDILGNKLPFAGTCYMKLQETYLYLGDTVPDTYSRTFERWLDSVSGKHNYRTREDVEANFYATFTPET